MECTNSPTTTITAIRWRRLSTPLTLSRMVICFSIVAIFIFWGNISKERRQRTSFTRQQLEVLEESFNENHYPEQQDRIQLSDQFNMEERKIQVSFFSKSFILTFFFRKKDEWAWTVARILWQNVAFSSISLRFLLIFTLLIVSLLHIMSNGSWKIWNQSFEESEPSWRPSFCRRPLKKRRNRPDLTLAIPLVQ